MSAFLLDKPTAITKYYEQLVMRLIEKMMVFHDKFTVEFKSDVTIDIIEEHEIQ
jgi:site-specific DNA recombinase